MFITFSSNLTSNRKYSFTCKELQIGFYHKTALSSSFFHLTGFPSISVLQWGLHKALCVCVCVLSGSLAAQWQSISIWATAQYHYRGIQRITLENMWVSVCVCACVCVQKVYGHCPNSFFAACSISPLHFLQTWHQKSWSTQSCTKMYTVTSVVDKRASGTVAAIWLLYITDLLHSEDVGVRRGVLDLTLGQMAVLQLSL